MKRISIDTRCVTFIFLFGFTFLAGFAEANNEWSEFYNNTRSLGMGGASVAITSDETSVYRNPASLGSIRDFYGTVVDPEVEGSAEFTGSLKSQALSKTFDIQEIENKLTDNREKYFHAKAQVTPSVITRNFGVGLIYKNEVSAEMNKTATAMDLKYQNDMGVVVGGTLRLFDGRLKIGGSGKMISRIEAINSALPTNGPTDLGTIGSEGTAFAFDGGLLLQAPWAYLPTLGVVVRDIGATKFDKQDGLRLKAQSRPETVPQSVDAAFSLFPIHGSQLRSVWTLEYSDLTNSRNDTDSAKRIHAGLEVNVRDIFFFRVGYNQRYYTAGFEIAAEHFQWQIATYGEEIGTADTPREDRRYSAKISVRF